METPKRLDAKTVTVIEKYGRKVALELFREPDGKIDEWLLFSSKQTPVIVFPLTGDGQVVATRQFRYGANDVVLELPGGLVEERENWLEASTREVLEETGYQVGKTDDETRVYVTCIGKSIWFDPCCYSEQFIPVLATGCRKVAEPTADHCEAALFPVEEWYRMCVTGGVVDSKSLAVSLMVLPQLRKLGTGLKFVEGLLP